MDQLSIVDGDMLALHIRDIVGNTGLPGSDGSSQLARRPEPLRPNRGEQDPEVIRLQLLGNPRLRQEALRDRPELAATIDSPERFAQAYRQLQNRERDERLHRQQQIAALNADPFDIDAQMKIAEIIREQQVQENLHNAIEHNPEG